MNRKLQKTYSLALAGISFLTLVSAEGWAAPSKSAITKKTAPKSVSEDEFMTALQDRISNTPNNIKVAKDTSVVVLIKIAGNGNLEAVEVKQSSGRDDLDQESLKRVKQAAPFGPMPEAFKTGLNLTYTFQFQAPLGNQAGAIDTGPYMEKLSVKVGQLWSAPDVSRDCQVTVHFLLDKSGALKSASISKKSGFEEVDQRALEVVRRAAPFGPLPEGLASLPVNYMFSAGPAKGSAREYKFNGVPIEKGGWQVTRSGSTLKPLEVSKKTENKLQAQKWKVEDEISELQGRLEKAKTEENKAEILITIGRNYRKINDYENATRAFEKASTIYKSENSANEAVLKAELAEAYARKGDNQTALSLFEKASSTLREKPQENKEELKKVLTEYARTLYRVKNTEKADKLYAEIRSLK